MSRPMLRNQGPGFGARTVYDDGLLHWDLGAVTYVGNGTFTRDFKTFSNRAPGTNGYVQMFVGGDDKEGGELANFTSDTSNFYYTERLPPTYIKTVLRKSSIFQDRAFVSMHYNVRDEVGRAQTDTTNTIIRMWVTFGTSVAIFICDLPDNTGSGSCLGDFSATSPYADWFNDQNPSYLAAWVQVVVGSTDGVGPTDGVIGDFFPIILNEVPEYPALSAVGAMMNTGIIGPRYAGDAVDTTIFAHTGGQVRSVPTAGATTRYATSAT
jgi:hypothetical protein